MRLDEILTLNKLLNLIASRKVIQKYINFYKKKVFEILRENLRSFDA